MPSEPLPPTAFQRLTDFARRVIVVPKTEVDEQAKKYRRRRQRRGSIATFWAESPVAHKAADLEGFMGKPRPYGWGSWEPTR